MLRVAIRKCFIASAFRHFGRPIPPGCVMCGVAGRIERTPVRTNFTRQENVGYFLIRGTAPTPKLYDCNYGDPDR